MNNPQLLIDAIVQQTMVFIAQLATAGGVRAPLAGVADQVFSDLTEELSKQGVKKKVIADMFGMALRTYHRRTQELRLSRTEEGRTLWEAVYAFLRERERASAGQVHTRFSHDDPELVAGVLNDLVNSGLVYRAGRGSLATYKVADQADFDSADESRLEANRHLVWLCVYRNGPLDGVRVAEMTRIGQAEVETALLDLVDGGQARRLEQGERVLYESDSFDVPLGSTQGWEAAVLDHFQAMIRAILCKLQRGPHTARQAEVVGGSTWSLDVWPGHPLEREAKDTLSSVRRQVEDLRRRIDLENLHLEIPENLERVIVYVGQYLHAEETNLSGSP